MSIDKLSVNTWGSYAKDVKDKTVIYDVEGAYPELKDVPGVTDYAQRGIGLSLFARYIPWTHETLPLFETLRKTRLPGKKEIIYISRDNFLEHAVGVIMEKQTNKIPPKTVLENLVLFGYSKHSTGILKHYARKYKVEDTDFLDKIWTSAGTDSESSPNNKALVRTLISEFESEDNSNICLGSFNPQYESASEFIANLNARPDTTEILKALSDKKYFGERVVVKPSLSGASGVGVELYDLSYQLEAFAERIANNPQNLLIEEALDIDYEISMQIHVTDSKEVLYLGLTEQRIENNAHTGNLISFEKSFENKRIDDREKRKVLKIVEYIAQKTGYKGYLSVDIARTNEGTLKILEINARFGGASAPLMLLRRLAKPGRPTYVEYSQFGVKNPNPGHILGYIGPRLLSFKNNVGIFPLMVSQEASKVGMLFAHTSEDMVKGLKYRTQKDLSK